MIVDGKTVRSMYDTSSLGLAMAFIADHGRDDGEERTLRHWRGDFYRWDSVTYKKVELEEFRAQVHEFLKSIKINRKGRVDLYKPEPRNVKAVIETLAAECQARVPAMPAWMDKPRPKPQDIVAFRNGLLDLGNISHGLMPPLIPPTPMWFSTTAIPYEFRIGNPCPQWDKFLCSSLRKNGTVDRGAIALLQEWFGYCMTADTRHQKLMLLVGPPRCGKGTIIRALQRLVGQENCASPQFNSLNRDFGLEPLIGKRVATVADAHLGRDDNAVGVLDRILQISGEDSVTVNRKYKPAIPDVRLGVRFTIGANEPPDLPDSSGAIIPRLLMIQFNESFAGREDLALDTRLSAETVGIAIWALEGLKRLRATERFTEPDDSAQLKNDYMRQTAPIHAFLQDRCELGVGDEHCTPFQDLWQAWKTWAMSNGNHPGSREGFSKRLHTACATLRRKRGRDGIVRRYEILGIRILPEGELPFRPGDNPYDEEPPIF